MSAQALSRYQLDVFDNRVNGVGRVVGDEVRVIVACLGGEVHIVIRTLVFARSEIGMLWTGVRRGVVQADLGS